MKSKNAFSINLYGLLLALLVLTTGCGNMLQNPEVEINDSRVNQIVPTLTPLAVATSVANEGTEEPTLIPSPTSEVSPTATLEPTVTPIEETDAEETDAEETDAEETDAEETDAEETDTEETDAEETDAEETDTEETDAEETDTEETDTEETDAEETDAEETDAEETDAEETDAEETDAEEADATPSPTATPTTNPEAEIEYEVVSGDTAYGIALEYEVDVDELLAYNEIEDPEFINIGTVLRIPVGEAAVAAQPTITSTAEITSTPEISSTVTLTVTATPEATELPEPTATPSDGGAGGDGELPARVELDMSHTYQDANNCAPASTSTALSFFGLNQTQFDMAALQKPNSDDVNVTAEEVAASIRQIGMNAYVGYNGDVDLMIRLAAAGFPAMTEEWMEYDGGMGHFRTVGGYDLELNQILHHDSYYGPGLWRDHDTFLEAWGYYNNKYVVPYHPYQEEQLIAIIGDNWDENQMYQNLRDITQARVNDNPDDVMAWWGLGEALLYLGQPADAIYAFEEALALNTLPWRYMWYRYGYLEALNQVGRYEDMLVVSEQTLNEMGLSENIRYLRAQALNALGRTDEAISELYAALEDNPQFTPATVLLNELGG